MAGAQYGGAEEFFVRLALAFKLGAPVQLGQAAGCALSVCPALRVAVTDERGKRREQAIRFTKLQ